MVKPAWKNSDKMRHYLSGFRLSKDHGMCVRAEGMGIDNQLRLNAYTLNPTFNKMGAGTSPEWTKYVVM